MKVIVLLVLFAIIPGCRAALPTKEGCKEICKEQCPKSAVEEELDYEDELPGLGD